ncbi:MAG: beta-ketoacyl-ACP synthase II [Chloroflexota bacterium]
MTNRSERKRVVITGLGAVTPLGSTLEQYWDGLAEGRSGIRRITQFDPSELACQIAGDIPDFNVELYMDRKEARRTPRACQVALAAGTQAVKDAGLGEKMPVPERAGVLFGTVMGGVDKIIEGVETYNTSGLSKIGPFVLPTSIPNIPAFMLAQQFQCLGYTNTISTACATGTQAIGEAAEVIRRGAADVMITGGVEALLRIWTIGGFCAMRALPVNFNDAPAAASRPFDSKREGFIFSEGAGALVLESLEHALERKARIYAEVAGHASAADAYHIAAPEPDGLGGARAMRWALEDAGMQPEAVDYINAHGSSTPANDGTETRAIKSVFGEHAYKLAVSSTKSMIGHPMGAAGAVEALACLLAIHRGIIPPTINYEYPDPECDLDYVPNHARRAEVNVCLSNSFGLGGQNASLILKRYVP